MIRPQVAVSVNDASRSGLFRSFSYRSGGIVPPHGVRAIRLLWRSRGCFLGQNFAGEYELWDTLTLWVKIGWITRTEVIPLPAEFAIAQTAATVQNCDQEPAYYPRRAKPESPALRRHTQ